MTASAPSKSSIEELKIEPLKLPDESIESDGDMKVFADNSLIVKTKKKIYLEAIDDVTIKVGGSTVVIKSGSVEIKSPLTKIIGDIEFSGGKFTHNGSTFIYG